MSLGRSVLITGANRGLGLEFIRQLLAFPEDAPELIFAACRNPDNAQDLKSLAEKSPKRVHVIKLDVSKDEDIPIAVKDVESTLGGKGLNLLINNAGILDRTQTDFRNLSRSALIESFNTNTLGPLFVTAGFHPLLKKAAQETRGPLSCQRAAVINMSTGIASIGDNKSGGGVSGYAYRLTKTALNQATRCLAMDMKGDEILCINILPGYVKTDMTGWTGEITAQESVSSMLSTMAKFGPDHNGGFYNRLGKEFPW